LKVVPSLLFCFSCQAAAAAVARSKENFTYMSDAVLLRSSWSCWFLLQQEAENCNITVSVKVAAAVGDRTSRTAF
jgi:hypothetical protein